MSRPRIAPFFAHITAEPHAQVHPIPQALHAAPERVRGKAPFVGQALPLLDLVGPVPACVVGQEEVPPFAGEGRQAVVEVAEHLLGRPSVRRLGGGQLHAVQRGLPGGAALHLVQHETGDPVREGGDVHHGHVQLELPSRQPLQGLVGRVVGSERTTPVEEPDQRPPQSLELLARSGRVGVQARQQPLEPQGGGAHRQSPWSVKPAQWKGDAKRRSRASLRCALRRAAAAGSPSFSMPR